MTRFALALMLSALPAPTLADEAALLLGNGRYDSLDRVRGASDIGAAVDALEDEGVSVVSGRDLDRDDLFERVRAFSQMTGDADRLAVVLSGRFATLGGTTWFLPADADSVGVLDVAQDGVPVALLADLMQGTPGRGLLVLGADAPDALPQLDPPAGVTFIVTDPRGALRFAEEVLADPGASVAQADGDFRIEGYMTSGLSFLDTDDEPETRPGRGRGADFAYWLLTERRDDAASYRAYLDRYPDGQYVDEARTRLAALTETPEQRAERIEDDLGLTREGRVQIQQDLTALGYDTRGVDGIFGPGTRNALRGWQNRNGFDVTGFLNTGQLERLTEQGAERAVEIAAEEERQREERRRADEDLWASLGSERTENELEGYLDQFPEGIHAADARRRLEELRPPQESDASRRERQIWQVTQQENTVQGYRAFLEAFPDGAFAGEARASIDRLQRGSGNARNRDNAQNRDNRANPQAEAAENALGLTTLTRRAVEQRLAQLGFEAGTVDGQFDRNTRRALEQYQQSAGLRATGYVDQGTAVRLLSDTLRDLLR